MVTAHFTTWVDGVIPTKCPRYDQQGSFAAVELPRLCCSISSDRIRSQPNCRPTWQSMSAHHHRFSQVLAASQIVACW